MEHDDVRVIGEGARLRAWLVSIFIVLAMVLLPFLSFLLVVSIATEPILGAVREHLFGVLLRTSLVLQAIPAVLTGLLVMVVLGGISRDAVRPRGDLLTGALLASALFLPISFLMWCLGVQVMAADSRMVVAGTPPICGQPIFGFIVLHTGTLAILPAGFLAGWLIARLAGRLRGGAVDSMKPLQGGS